MLSECTTVIVLVAVRVVVDVIRDVLTSNVAVVVVVETVDVGSVIVRLPLIDTA